MTVQHPDEIAAQIQRTSDYIRARYGDGPIPAAVTTHSTIARHTRWLVSRRDGGFAECLECGWRTEATP